MVEKKNSFHIRVWTPHEIDAHIFMGVIWYPISQPNTFLYVAFIEKRGLPNGLTVQAK